jgi:chromosome segregation ATPase
MTAIEKKSNGEIVTSLRRELQLLYDSLKDKNEQLMSLEQELLDRDAKIKSIKEDFSKRHAQTCSNCSKKIHPDMLLSKLQKDLEDRENAIKEMNRKIARLSDNLIFVQKESLSKDDKIEHLSHEIDKFRQVVNYLFKIVKMVYKRITNNMHYLGSTFHKSRH